MAVAVFIFRSLKRVVFKFVGVDKINAVLLVMLTVAAYTAVIELCFAAFAFIEYKSRFA